MTYSGSACAIRSKTRYPFVAVNLASGPLRVDSEQPTDAALMQRLAQKDSSALETLYDRYSRQVYSLVVRIVQQAANAEEVLQDVFLQLWRNAQQYDAARGALSPWLLTIARHRALDVLRLKSERQRQQEGEMGAREVVCGAPSPETLADQEVRASRVREVMAALPELQRRAIELAYFEGMTHSEIAAKMSEPLGTVKSWIRGGLLRLREELEAAP
jgi:RNA polymerase sigma-70 factor, ECF subfamily